MLSRADKQKEIERWYLTAARNAGVPIPLEEISDEEPDFRFQRTGSALGIELTEVLRPASSNHGIRPVEEDSFHQEIMEMAQKQYYTDANATPVHVSVYFTNARGNKSSKFDLARACQNLFEVALIGRTRSYHLHTEILRMVSIQLSLQQSPLQEVGGTAKSAASRWEIYVLR